jgi:DNA-binding NarL/FixJ family response regulator
MRGERARAMLGPMPLRCLIVDDNVSFIEASRSALESQGAEVVGVATNAAEALHRLGQLTPDVVLLDIDLGDESGFDLARRLQDGLVGSPPKVILISTYPAEDFADLVAESPAVGFIAKSELSTDAVEEVLRDAESGRADRP